MRFPPATTLLAVSAVLTACAAAPVAEVKLVPKGGGNAEKARSITLAVNAPAGLVAAGGGNLVNADPAGLAAAGGVSLVAAGGGNIVSAGAGNLGPVRAPAFRVQAATAKFKPVAKAVVYWTNLTVAGEIAGKTAGTTDATGKITFANVQDGKPLSAVAVFKLGDKVYRMAAPVAIGSAEGGIMIDPINTFVEGRIRAILKGAGKVNMAAIVGKELTEIWGLFNDVLDEIDFKILENGTSIDDLERFYQQASEKLPEADRAKVTAYMAKIRGSD